jgi:hypothetical protein
MADAVGQGEFAHGEEWFTSDGHSQEGPFTGDAIVRAATEGELRGSDYLWKAGMANWVLVRDLVDIRPPPSPKLSTSPPASSQIPPQVGEAATKGIQPASNNKPLVGLEGWLWLVFVQLTVSLVLGILLVLGLVLNFDQLPVTTSNRVGFLISILASFVLGIIYPLILLRKFFSREANFPRHYIIWIWLGTAFPLLNRSLIEELSSKDRPRELTFIIMSAIWTSYMLRSERVKATFVRKSSWLVGLSGPSGLLRIVEQWVRGGL